MDNMESIKKWFKAEMKDRMDEQDLRPHHLMGLCKMEETEVRKSLDGESLPGIFSLVLLAELFECTVNDLLGYEEVEETEIYERYIASSLYFHENQYAICLADRVHRYFEVNELSFTTVAPKMGINPATMRGWFSSTRPRLPKTEKFLGLCEVLDVTPTELLGY